MELLQLRYFCDAAKLENFSTVAKAHHVPQPSISRSISRLEQELGCKLFTRSGKKIFLNTKGKLFYDRVSSAIELIDDGATRITENNQSTVRLVVFDSAKIMISLMADFHRDNQNVRVELAKMSDRWRGNLFYDVRVTYRPYKNDSEDISIPLYKEKLLVAVSKNSPLAKKEKLNFDDIRDLPLAGLSPGGWLEEKVKAYYSKHDASPNVILESSMRGIMAETVKHDFGIAFFPEHSWAEIKEEGICTLELEDNDIECTAYISYPKMPKPSDATKQFIEYSIENIHKYLK